MLANVMPVHLGINITLCKATPPITQNTKMSAMGTSEEGVTLVPLKGSILKFCVVRDREHMKFCYGYYTLRLGFTNTFNKIISMILHKTKLYIS